MGSRNAEVFLAIVRAVKPHIAEQLALLEAAATGSGEKPLWIDTPMAGGAEGHQVNVSSAQSVPFNFLHTSTLCYGLARAG